MPSSGSRPRNTENASRPAGTVENSFNPACRADVTGTIVPPVAGRRRIGSRLPPTRIVPSRAQVPPMAPRFAICWTAPVSTSMRLMLIAVTYPTVRLSGDQNGKSPSSVPGSGRVTSESSERSHRRVPSSVWTGKTILRPSGETAIARELEGGVLISSRTSCGVICCRSEIASSAVTVTTAINAPIQMIRSRVCRTGTGGVASVDQSVGSAPLRSGIVPPRCHEGAACGPFPGSGAARDGQMAACRRAVDSSLVRLSTPRPTSP